MALFHIITVRPTRPMVGIILTVLLHYCFSFAFAVIPVLALIALYHAITFRIKLPNLCKPNFKFKIKKSYLKNGEHLIQQYSVEETKAESASTALLNN